MSGDFNASVVISTAESEKGIRNLDGAAKDLDSTLRNLDGALKANQGNLDAVAKSMSSIVSANAALIRSDRERAKATTEAARADGVRIVNAGKAAKAVQQQAIAEAKIARIKQGGVASGLSSAATVARRDAEARARMDSAAVLGAQRLASETERTAAAATRGAMAQQQLAGATARTELTQLRLAQAQERARNNQLALNDSLSNSRYLLYDVGQTFTVISAALLALPVATSEVAIAYERDFAQVIRTNNELAKTEGISVLRDELKQLATEIPLTFSQFSNIASIAGQLGIAGKDVGAFTETVARFGAASNVSIDEAATAFGRLQNSFDPLRKTPDFFNKIGSAIAFVGVNSTATESEIIAVTNQIAAAGAQFNFTAQDIVGLSGALASVRIRPELARGAFQRIMLQLSRAADEGGAAFDRFAKYTGKTGEAARELFKNDPSAFFNQYIAGISGTIQAGNSVSAVLDDIGAKNVFDKQFILGLAGNMKVYNQALADSSKAFGEGTFLNESTAGVFDTVDAKLKRIANTFKNLMDSIGKGSVGGGLADLADTLLSVASATDRLARSSEVFSGFINVVLGLGTAVGILLAFKAAQAFTLAGLVGFQQVLGKGTLAAGLSAKGILQQLAQTMLMSKGVTAAAAAEYIKAAGAMRAMGFAGAATNTQIGALNSGVLRAGASATSASGRLAQFGTTMRGIGTGMLGLVGGPIGALIIGIGAIGLKFIEAEEKANRAGDAIARAMQNGADAGKRAIGEQLIDRTVDSFNWNDTAAGLGDHGKNVRKLADEIGLDFNRIVDSIAKGTNATAEFKKVSDDLARSKGFKDFADMQARSTDGSAQKMEFINRVVEEMGRKFAERSKDLESVEKSVKGSGDAANAATDPMKQFSASLDETGDDAKTAAEKIDNLIDKIFGIANAEAATQSALSSLGASLAESTDFGTGTEGGRANIQNYQDVLASAMKEQQGLIETTGKSVQQATADYFAFVDGLTQEMAARGVDPAQVAAVAQQAKDSVSQIFGEVPVDVPVTVDAPKVVADAAAVKTSIQTVLQGIKADAQVGADITGANIQLDALVRSLMTITGLPYDVVMDALTDPANEKSMQVYDLLTSIVNNTYTAPVDADTTAAIANVQNFIAYARTELSRLQTEMNGGVGYADGEGSMSPAQKAQFSALGAAPAQVAAPAPAQVAAPVIPTPNLGGLADGYNKARDAANKAGDAGKKAGKDMANGIDDATEAVNDYAKRLREGLQSAFDQQHALQKATDDYHSALNAIKKKREEELEQISDLIEKQKELNNERNEELVNARKAGIEKDISLKYGETDRAADYAAQEQKALDAAAAKQKDIAANQKTITSLQQGMYALDGYSQAAIDNREAIRNLESKMIDMISAYAATGASQQQVAAYAEALTGKFRTQVLQMGYNQGSVNALIGTTQRYIDTVYRVPSRVSTTADNNFGSAAGAAGNLGRAIGGIPTSVKTTARINYSSADLRRMAQVAAISGNVLQVSLLSAAAFAAEAQGFAKGGQVPGFASGGLIPGTPPGNPNKDNLLANVDNKGMISVRSREFIMSQPAVDYWGTDFMNALNNMQMPHFFSGGKVGGGSGGSGSNGTDAVLVELTAENIQAILRLADRPVNLFADVEKLASTVDKGKTILASKGVK